MLYNILADDIFVLRNIRTAKCDNISVERKVTLLWGICDLRDYNFTSRNTKYSFRPTHVWYEAVISHSVFFPFDY